MKRYDIIIRGAELLDGTGADPARNDIGIVGDRIGHIGDLRGCDAETVIDAAGKHVAPGFIDVHTHSDISVLYNPQMDSVLSQGVTTQVVGNCSICFGFVTENNLFAFEKRWLRPHGAQITWDTFDQHLATIEQLGVSTNYVMLAGQGTLRKRCMGQDDRPASVGELGAMQNRLAQAMQAGAWGISSGLEYTPSSYADATELTALASIAGQYGGIYASHLRNEGDKLVEAVQEAIDIGENGCCPVQLSHHKAEGRRNWGKVHKTLGMVDAARARGLDVQLDVYPYNAFMTSMSVQFLPAWANVGDNDVVLGRLADPVQRQRIVNELRAQHPDWDDLGPDTTWNDVEIGVCRTNRAIQGRTIADLAREAGRNPIEMTLDIILQERNGVSAVNFAISEQDIATVMRHPYCMIGSDAIGVAPRDKMADDRVHPRCYGTFPRVLARYVRDLGVLTEAEAVRKMTSLPADRFGIAYRGRLAQNYYADLVVYDPETISDRATFEDPHQFSVGIDAVVVNGRLSWTAEGHTGAMQGMVLRKGQ